MLQLNDILLARDFSPISNQALRYALDLASRTGATLHLLYAEVLYEDPFASGEQPSPAATVERIREELRRGANGETLPTDPADVEITEAVVRDVAAGPAILNYAAEHDVDLIALGTHGRRGVRHMLLGSVAEEVVRRSDRPVLTVRGREEAEDASVSAPEVRQVLVPVDFSDHAREALRYARELAALYEARITALHVLEEKLHPAFYVGGVRSIYDIDPEIDEKVRRKLATFVENTEGPRAEIETHVIPGRPGHRIARFADEHDADLVVMSTHGLTGLEHFLIGSVAEKTVRQVACPVLTVKAFGKSLIQSTAAEAASSTH